jgi:glucose-6-phosphate 1-dehydrogenase
VSAVAERADNPLVEGLERLPIHPTTLVIFGATGDLAKRKLLPALYNLAHEGALPERFNLIGVSRSDQAHEAFRAQAQDAIKEFSRREPDPAVLDKLLDEVRYVPGVFDDGSVYETLGKTLDEFDDAAGVRMNRCFYLSTAPMFFPVIVGQLGEHKLVRHEGADVRVVIEKPFGTTLAEAEALNREVLSVLDEHQVFRIDHYLGKETVQNMMAFRFANGLFEPVWNRNYIDQIQITAAEDIGIGSRAGYYDSAGALRDLIQNHMLQLLCHVAMEPPVNFTADEVRNEKVKVLQAIHAPTEEQIDEIAVRAQYAEGESAGEHVGGYLQEHEDLCGAAPGGRQLALGRGAVLPAHGQAPGAQGHRGRGDAQAGPASGLQAGGLARRPAQPAHPHHAAQRGREPVAGRQDPRHAHADPSRVHGVPLRDVVPVAVARGLRAPDHGCHARRRDALQP